MAFRGKAQAISIYIKQMDCPKAKSRGEQRAREKRVLCLVQQVVSSFLTHPELPLHVTHRDLKDIITNGASVTKKLH